MTSTCGIQCLLILAWLQFAPVESAFCQQANSSIPEATFVCEPPKISPKEHKNTGFLDFNFYPYMSTVPDNSVTINALANLPNGFQYFSLTNFENDPNRDELTEIGPILTEQNLRWQPSDSLPLTFAAQALIRSGDSANDALRMGPRFTLHDFKRGGKLFEAIGLSYWIAIYAVQFDHKAGNQWQMEHVFKAPVFPELFDNRVSISGFIDHNIDHDGTSSSTWLEETQLAVRVFNQWHLVAEQRYNGFRKGAENSLGVGVEYLIRFP